MLLNIFYDVELSYFALFIKKKKNGFKSIFWRGLDMMKQAKRIYIAIIISDFGFDFYLGFLKVQTFMDLDITSWINN